VALLLLIVGAVCLAIAVFRARVVPLWVGVALIASVVCAFGLHGGAVDFISDYLILAALFCFGWYAARPVTGTSSR
jgi:membrane protein implicated in regulation of membrane protease activity